MDPPRLRPIRRYGSNGAKFQNNPLSRPHKMVSMTNSAAGPGTIDLGTFHAMKRFITTRLSKTVDMGDATFVALSETAERFNETRWFWTDDNAKAAELLCEPAFYDADPAPADAAIDFVRRMSTGAVIQRRCGPPELRILSTDPKAFRAETAFFILEGDLSLGVVRQSLRFNDGRTVVAAQHTGNMVHLHTGRRKCVVDVEGTINDYGVETGTDSFTVWHSSRIAIPATPWLRQAAKPVGRLRYSYSISAHRPSVTLTVEFALDDGVSLDNLSLSTALDQLSRIPGIDYRSVSVRTAGVDKFIPRVADATSALHTGRADYIGISQVGASPGFSYGIHILLPDGAKLREVTASGQKGGLLHWLVQKYRMGAVPSGGTVRLTEERMLTGGGYYDALSHYEAVLRGGLGGGGYDPSMTYDIGAELNAVATQILFARSGRYARPPSGERLAELRAWYDRHLQRYFEFVRPGTADDLARLFTRGIGYVALSLDCMLRATGEATYRQQLDLAVSLILRMGRRLQCGRDEHDLTFGDVWAGHVPFLDNHAACVLALARAAWYGDPDGALSRAVNEGILGIKLHSAIVDLGNGHTIAADSLATLNVGANPHADTGFWNFKLGVVLRALHAAEYAADAGKLQMDSLARKRLSLRRDLCVELLEMSMRWHTAPDGQPMMEVLTARIAGETNSETQPWVALGLFPTLDEQVVAIAPPTPVAAAA